MHHQHMDAHQYQYAQDTYFHAHPHALPHLPVVGPAPFATTCPVHVQATHVAETEFVDVDLDALQEEHDAEKMQYQQIIDDLQLKLYASHQTIEILEQQLRESAHCILLQQQSNNEQHQRLQEQQQTIDIADMQTQRPAPTRLPPPPQSNAISMSTFNVSAEPYATASTTSAVSSSSVGVSTPSTPPPPPSKPADQHDHNLNDDGDERVYDCNDYDFAEPNGSPLHLDFDLQPQLDSKFSNPDTDGVMFTLPTDPPFAEPCDDDIRTCSSPAPCSPDSVDSTSSTSNLRHQATVLTSNHNHRQMLAQPPVACDAYDRIELEDWIADILGQPPPSFDHHLFGSLQRNKYRTTYDEHTGGALYAATMTYKQIAHQQTMLRSTQVTHPQPMFLTYLDVADKRHIFMLETPAFYAQLLQMLDPASLLRLTATCKKLQYFRFLSEASDGQHCIWSDLIRRDFPRLWSSSTHAHAGHLSVPFMDNEAMFENAVLYDAAIEDMWYRKIENDGFWKLILALSGLAKDGNWELQRSRGSVVRTMDRVHWKRLFLASNRARADHGYSAYKMLLRLRHSAYMRALQAQLHLLPTDDYIDGFACAVRQKRGRYRNGHSMAYFNPWQNLETRQQLVLKMDDDAGTRVRLFECALYEQLEHAPHLPHLFKYLARFELVGGNCRSVHLMRQAKNLHAFLRTFGEHHVFQPQLINEYHGWIIEDIKCRLKNVRSLIQIVAS